MRFVSWTSLALNNQPVKTLFERVCQALAFIFNFGVLTLVAIYMLEKLALPFRERGRRVLFVAFWALFFAPLVFIVLYFVLAKSEWKPLLIAQESEAMDLTLIAYSLACCCGFTAAAVYTSGWRRVFSSLSRLRARATHLRVMRVLILVVVLVLLLRFVTALLCVASRTLLPLYVRLVLLYWLPETVPVGVILLYIMRKRDSRTYMPLVFGLADDPHSWHVISTSNNGAGHEVNVMQPPRAPSVELESGAAQPPAETLVAGEYRPRIVSRNTPAHVTLALVRCPDTSTGFAACAEAVAKYSDAPTESEIDRTEVLASASGLQFAKTLLVRDQELATEHLPLLVAFCMDKMPPTCLGCQFLTPEGLMGKQIVLMPPLALFHHRQTKEAQHRRAARARHTAAGAQTTATLTTRLLDTSLDTKDDDEAEAAAAAASTTTTSKKTKKRGLARAMSGTWNAESYAEDAMAIVLEKQGDVVPYPKSTLLGSCIRTFQFAGQVEGRAARISTKHEFWQSNNAFELPRQMLEQLVTTRRAQLHAAKRELKSLRVTTLASPESTEDDEQDEEDKKQRKQEKKKEEEDEEEDDEQTVRFTNALHTVQDLTTTTMLLQQYRAAVGCFEEHITAMERAIAAYSADQLKWSFKPSVMKLDSELRFVPTNLHTEVMSVATERKTAPHEQLRPPATYASVTCGVPSALVYKSLPTGARELRKRIAFLRSKGTVTTTKPLPRTPGDAAPPPPPSPSPSPSPSLPAAAAAGHSEEEDDKGDVVEEEYGVEDEAGELARMTNDMLQAALERKAVELLYTMRRDVTRAQLLPVVADAFTAELERRLVLLRQGHDVRAELADFLGQVGRCGFLVQFESLLSTRGSERAMIGDFEDAVRMLRAVRLRLVRDDREDTFVHSAALTRTSIASIANNSTSSMGSITSGMSNSDSDECGWIIDIACPPDVFCEAPARLQGGGLADVTGILFTQGINEQQTMANVLGEAALQDSVNRSAFPVLEQYFLSYAEWRRLAAAGARPADAAQAERDLAALAQQLAQIGRMAHKRSLRTSKNTRLLPCVADLCRALRAGRCTSCKSGKDRTAMSVTWEQARVLTAAHGLPEAALPDVLRVLREAGVRRFNVIKNTGGCWYAFTPIQHKLLPAVYRAPRASRSTAFLKTVPT